MAQLCSYSSTISIIYLRLGFMETWGIKTKPIASKRKFCSDIWVPLSKHLLFVLVFMGRTTNPMKKGIFLSCWWNGSAHAKVWASWCRKGGRSHKTSRDQGKEGCDKRHIYMKKTKKKVKGKGLNPSRSDVLSLCLDPNSCLKANIF